MNKFLKSFISVLAPLSILVSTIGCSCVSNGTKQDQLINPKIEKIEEAVKELKNLVIEPIYFKAEEALVLNADVTNQISKKIIKNLQDKLFFWIIPESLAVEFYKPRLVFVSKQDFAKPIFF